MLETPPDNIRPADFFTPVVIRVRTYELDSFGHVNNAVYLNYLEEARSEYLKQMGVTFHDFVREGVQLVIAEAHIRYITPLRYGDAAAVACRVTEVRAASVTLEYTVTEAASGRLAAEASTRGAFVDGVTARPTRAPKLFAEAFRRAAAGQPVP